MVFTARLRERVRSGRIRCSVRFWSRPQVKAGGKYAMEDGHIVVETIARIPRSAVTVDLARESGFESLAGLLAVAQHGSSRTAYLVRFHYLPPGAWATPTWTTAAASARPSTVRARRPDSTRSTTRS